MGEDKMSQAPSASAPDGLERRLEDWAVTMRDDHHLTDRGRAVLESDLRAAAVALSTRPPGIDGQAAERENLRRQIENFPHIGLHTKSYSVSHYLSAEQKALVLAALAAAPPAQGSAGWREVCGVLRGLLYYADGHGLQARDARTLRDLKERANKLLALAPPVEAWKSLRDEFREAVTAKDESTLSDAICRIMGNCDCPGDHGADPETALCWKAAKAILAPPVEAQGSERVALQKIMAMFSSPGRIRMSAGTKDRNFVEEIYDIAKAALGDSSPATEERYGLWIDPGPKR